jgi:hypothetical protein
METLQRTANRGSISTGFDIDNSVKLEPDNSEYFQRPAAGSNGSLTTWTFSLWLKRTELSHNNIFYSQGGNGRVRFESDDTFSFRYKSGNELTTSRVFRDTSAWYHIVIAVDTTQATASDRVKIYFNGVQETMSGTQPTLNATSDFGAFSTVTAQLGQFTEGAYYFAGYMAEFYWIDGIQQAPTEFGEFDSDTGIWKPIEYTGSFGSEGVYLDFEDAANLGDDVSGNGNDYTQNNITAADQATDTPTNNFCTLNPLHYSTWYSINQGATNQISSANGWGAAVSSVGVTQGKWYFETYCSDTAGLFLMGVIDDANVQSVINADVHAGDAQYGISYYASSGAIIANTQTQSSYSFPSYRQDIMGCALDLDNGYLYFSKNGTWGNSGDPTSGSSGTGAITLPTGGTGLWYFSTSTYYAAHPQQTNHGGFTTISISTPASDENGYGTFEYAPPSGYYALCTKNLAEYG